MVLAYLLGTCAVLIGFVGLCHVWTIYCDAKNTSTAVYGAGLLVLTFVAIAAALAALSLVMS